MRMMPERRIHT